MIALTDTPAKIGAFFVGVALHVLVFRTGEWDLATTKIIVSSATAQAAAVLGLVYFGPPEYNSTLWAVKTVSTLFWCLVTGLTISILLYRGIFHRLRGFPGPYLARFSNIYVTSLSVKRLHLYEEVQSLHQQYGDYVRLGTILKCPIKSRLTWQDHLSSLSMTQTQYQRSYQIARHVSKDLGIMSCTL